MSRERPFLSRCTSCGGEIAWIRTAAREGKPSKWMPVQIMRKDGQTAVHPDDTFAQGTHAPHWQVCPFAESHRSKRIGKIVEKAEAQHPPEHPFAGLSDDDLRARIAAGAEYEKAGPLPPKWARKLAALRAEQERRQIEAGKKILTIQPGYPWGNT